MSRRLARSAFADRSRASGEIRGGHLIDGLLLHGVDPILDRLGVIGIGRPLGVGHSARRDGCDDEVGEVSELSYGASWVDGIYCDGEDLAVSAIRDSIRALGAVRPVEDDGTAVRCIRREVSEVPDDLVDLGTGHSVSLPELRVQQYRPTGLSRLLDDD